MSRQHFSVARMETRTRESIGKYERHNGRKNEHYGNMNADLSRTPMNVLQTLRRLKKDAKIFGEIMVDVKPEYRDGKRYESVGNHYNGVGIIREPSLEGREEYFHKHLRRKSGRTAKTA